MDQNKTRDDEVDRIRPCDHCGYVFDHGSHGARMCPQCIRDFWARVDQQQALSHMKPPTDAIH
jgi:hypothetical protein